MDRGAHILTATLRRFLAKPLVARLATIGPDGYPHVVPIYFVRDGDDLVFGTDRDERKVRNAAANPKAAVVIGGDPDSDEAGYLFQGHISVEDDDHVRLKRRLARRYDPGAAAGASSADYADGDTVLLRLKPSRVIRVW